MKNVETIGARSMLLQFYMKNFKSFAEDTTVDFIASPKCRELPGFTINHRKTKILPCIALFGANASGKSNVIEGFARMTEIVRNNHDDYSVIVPFIFDETHKYEPTVFEVTLCEGMLEFRFGISVDKSDIVKEWLYVKRSGARYANEEEDVVYERENSSITFISDSVQLDNPIRTASSKKSLLSTLAENDVPIAKAVYTWFSNSNAFHATYLENNTRSLRAAAELMGKVPSVFEFCNEFIHKFDPCIEALVLIDDIDKDQIPYKKIMTKHCGSDRQISFNIESAGTKKLLRTLVHLTVALKLGSVVLIDELDSRLHPLLLREIVSMFHDPSINTAKGQLLFSTHNVTLLDGECLRRDEIWFTQKEISGKSCLYSLIDIKLSGTKRVRSDLRYMKNYLLGKFGAIPYRRE